MYHPSRTDDASTCASWGFVRDVFAALAVTCVLYAAHRIANGLLLGARITALREVGEAYTPEEREVLIHRIKHGSLGQ
jgi:hypothetical protein